MSTGQAVQDTPVGQAGQVGQQIRREDRAEIDSCLYTVKVVMVSKQKNKLVQHVIGMTVPMSRREASMVASEAAMAMRLAKGE